MVAAIGAVAGVAGSLISADGAKSAANAQSQSADQASQAQLMAAAQMRQDLAPWTQAGGAAQSRLNQLLGIGGAGSGQRTSMGLATGLSPDQVRQQLLAQYTRQSTAPNAGPMYRTGMDAINALGPQGAHDYFQQRNTQGSGSDFSNLWSTPDMTNPGMDGQPRYAGGAQQGPASTVDEEGLNAAIAQYYREQDAMDAAAAADPTYGSLLRAYRNGEEFSFTGKDLANDPGYQFGLNQGTQGIERGQAARGNFLSGAAMKELDRFNQDYAGTKFNDAFNRAQSTWTTNLNAYDNNRSRVYDFLTGVSRTGQNSAAQVGTANQNAATSIGNNLMASGNVNAASSIAGSNALRSGINQAANSINSVGGWNNLLSGFNIGRSGNNYNGSSGNMLDPNYENGMDRGFNF